METQTKNLLKFFIIPLILAAALAVGAYFEVSPDYKLHISFYDVGQGDAIFIETFLGTQVLLDGGPSSKVLQELGTDMPFYDRSLDLIILSHPHADHLNGLIEVLKRFKVKKVLLPNVEFDSEPYREFLKIIEDKHIEKTFAATGQRIWLDQATVLDIYFPTPGNIVADNDAKEGIGKDKRNPNDASIVAKLSFGQTQVLFTGDAGFEVENFLLPMFNLDSDILKVGHHGSKYSTSVELLNEVTPEYSVISVGKNSYGHPTKETLENIAQSNSSLLRTDQNGSIKFWSNGTNLFLK